MHVTLLLSIKTKLLEHEQNTSALRLSKYTNCKPPDIPGYSLCLLAYAFRVGCGEGDCTMAVPGKPQLNFNQ